MPRPSRPATSCLGVELRRKRGDAGLRETATALGLSWSGLSLIEHGARKPSIRSTLVLARWLGWTADEVLAAVDMPVIP